MPYFSLHLRAKVKDENEPSNQKFYEYKKRKKYLKKKYIKKLN